MKKILILSLVFGAVLAAVGIVIASDDGLQATEEGALWQLWDLTPAMQDAGNRNAEIQTGDTLGQPEHFSLVAKDPSNWTPIPDGAWGRMVYFAEDNPNDEFVFGGYLLEPVTKYTLLTYGGWSKIECMGTSEVSDENGYVNIKGSMPLQILTDEPEYGGKIWLVTSGRVNCDTGSMISWAPSEFLFEEVGFQPFVYIP